MRRIALDAMGGDRAPEETVAGAVDAASRGVDVVIVGDETMVRPILDNHSADLPLIHAPETIAMGEDPVAAIRDKKDASVSVCARLVADGEAAGMVSAGSTGAAMAAATLVIGRLPGIRRAAIATMFPSRIAVLDSGANIEVTPQILAQFAVMGAALVEIYFELDNPRVGLLNIGEEKGKGRDLEREAYDLLEAAAVDFVGNVEGRDVGTDKADVFVTDGFTGNVLLKAAEGTARWVSRLVASTLFEDPELQEHAAALAPKLMALREHLDPESYGGAHLVGTKGVVVIAHGSSSRRAIANALAMAAEGAERGLVEKVAAGIAAP